MDKVGKALVSIDNLRERVDISDKPSEIKLKHLDIAEGTSFEVCILNKATQHSDCTKAKNGSENSPEEVSLVIK